MFQRVEISRLPLHWILGNAVRDPPFGSTKTGDGQYVCWRVGEVESRDRLERDKKIKNDSEDVEMARTSRDNIAGVQQRKYNRFVIQPSPFRDGNTEEATISNGEEAKPFPRGRRASRRA